MSGIYSPLAANFVIRSECDKHTTLGKDIRATVLMIYTLNEQCKFRWSVVWQRIPPAPSVPPAYLQTEECGSTGDEVRRGRREESKRSPPAGKSLHAPCKNNEIITWETVESHQGQTFDPSEFHAMSATDPTRFSFWTSKENGSNSFPK